MKQILLYICLSLFFVSCRKQVPLQFSTTNYEARTKLNCKPGNCTYVHLEIPFASGPEAVSQSINKTLFQFVSSKICFENDKKTTSYDTLARHFIASYDEVNRIYPEEAIAWEANFKVSHEALSFTTYQVVWDYYIFTGGAHGLQASKVFFFDMNTGSTIARKDLFLNYEGFKNYAETEFRKQLNIQTSYNAAGFTFEDNKFHLPENFYQTEKEWVLYYNPYEIAPYVQGASVIKLPKEKVQPYLNPLHFKKESF